MSNTNKNPSEITADILIAIIEKGYIIKPSSTSTSEGNKAIAKEISETYKTIFKTVYDPND